MQCRAEESRGEFNRLHDQLDDAIERFNGYLGMDSTKGTATLTPPLLSASMALLESNLEGVSR